LDTLYEELDRRTRGKYHLPTRDEKKGKKKKGSAGHRGRRWQGAYCVHHTVRSFFHIKFFDFGDLAAGDSYGVIYTFTLLVLYCVFFCKIRVDGNQEAKAKVTTSTSP
jgi:hypothetical protein